MSEKIKKKIDEEIESELENLGCLEPGSEDHKAAVEDICKLRKVQMEEEHFQKEKEIEESVRETQEKETKRSNRAKLFLEIAGIAAPLGAYLFMFFKGLAFEETGTVTSLFNRNLLNRFRPSK